MPLAKIWMFSAQCKQTMKLGEYISSGGTKAAIEGSTHYGRNGDRLAAGLAEVRGECLHIAVYAAAAASWLQRSSRRLWLQLRWQRCVREGSAF